MMDTHPADLPGNSIAAATHDLERELFMPAAIMQCRDELLIECGRRTRAHDAYLDYVSDHGIVSHRAFVVMLEATANPLWTRRLESILSDLTAGPESA